jgi:L-fuconolactonase
MQGIVDSHVHLWNPQQLRYAWLDGLPQLNHAFLPNNFAQAVGSEPVKKIVFIECGRDSEQAVEEVDWVAALAKVEPRLKAIVAHAPMELGVAGRPHLLRLASRPLVRGVRRLLQGEADLDFCLRPDFIAGVKLLAEFNFTFDACVQHEQLPAVTELARRVPEVQFVLDHFGKPPVKGGLVEPWATQLRALAKLPNVVCKISGLTTEADWQSWKAKELRPYFETALAAFGYERVLFGGDWPVSTLATSYQRWLETVLELTATAGETDRQKLFQLNAERIYRV